MSLCLYLPLLTPTTCYKCLCISCFSHCCNTIPDNNKSARKGLLDSVWCNSTSWRGRSAGRDRRQLVTCCQKEEQWKLNLLSSFYSVLSFNRLGLFSLIYSVLKFPQRHGQRFVTIVIVNPIKLIIEIKHHGLFTLPCLDIFSLLWEQEKDLEWNDLDLCELEIWLSS